MNQSAPRAARTGTAAVPHGGQHLGPAATSAEEVGSPPASAVLAAVQEEINQLPAQKPIAARVIATVDDETSSARDLGQLICYDPSLTVRIMKLANSTFYGMSGRVRSAQFAVTVLGFATVRSLAVAALAGLQDCGSLPPRFWERSISAALAAGLIAQRVAANPQDAFSAGLLLRLGQGLLFRVDPIRYTALLERSGNRRALLSAEAATYGSVHTRISASALAAWHFPADVTDMIAAVDSRSPIEPLGITARVALEISERIFTPGHAPQPLDQLTAGRVPQAQSDQLQRQVQDGIDDLLNAFVG